MQALAEKQIHCPYCDEPLEVLVDPSVSEQSYVEDCQVCCQPIVMEVFIDEEGIVELSARPENE